MEKKVVFNSVCVSCLWKNDGVSGKVKSHPRRIRNDVCGGVLKAIIGARKFLVAVPFVAIYLFRLFE